MKLMKSMNKYDIKKLNYCDLGIGYQCNYKCRMCYFWKNSPLNRNNVLDIQEWKDVLSQIADLPKQDGFMINFAGPGSSFAG